MFLENLDLFSVEKFRQTEAYTRGQCYNEQWYLCRKGVITASKAHEIITKINKVSKGGRGVVKHLVMERKSFWNDFCQSKYPSFKIWMRHGDLGSQHICRIH